MPNKKQRKLFDQPQEVINRWVAIKVIRIIRPYTEGVFRFKLRCELIYQERHREKTLNDALQTTVEEFKKLKKTEFEPLKVFFNISLFFLVAEKDIQTVKIDALSHRSSWKRNLCLRIMMLVVHELDISKVAPANKMNEAYDDAKISHELRKEMASSLKLMNKAQRKAKKSLSKIRNSAMAHRDSDALLQYDMINTMDTKEVMKIMASFYMAADLFIKTLPKVIVEASSLQSLANQYVKNT